MQLSRAEFEQGVTDWLNKPQQRVLNNTADVCAIVSNDWRAKREPFTGHIWLERLNKVVIGKQDPVNTDAAVAEAEYDELELQAEDEAACSPELCCRESRLCTVQSLVDLYVAYSPVYRVPVMYFRGRLPGGTVLPLERLLQSSFLHVSPSEYPLNTLQRANTDTAIVSEGTESAHFPAISQGEHPETGLPCFYLHPCETSNALGDVLAGVSRATLTPSRLIETWLMLVSTLLDIR